MFLWKGLNITKYRYTDIPIYRYTDICNTDFDYSDWRTASSHQPCRLRCLSPSPSWSQSCAGSCKCTQGITNSKTLWPTNIFAVFRQWIKEAWRDCIMLAGTLTTWRVSGWPGTQWREKVWSRTPVSALSLTLHHVCQMGQCHRKQIYLKKSTISMGIWLCDQVSTPGALLPRHIATHGRFISARPIFP